ncbi:hypothetical protein KCP76_24535 [Salmonella enterica subsp. enterica serovar Weltevreden]|nr:hypothetical protein KCP76_24535 [Salmonella enterica subsp. enterica serovar Weltevreden]
MASICNEKLTQNRKYDDLLKHPYAQTSGAPTWAGSRFDGDKTQREMTPGNTGLINAILFSYLLSILYYVFPSDAVHFLNVIESVLANVRRYRISASRL